MNINIKDKDIELKYSFRAFLLYENITDKPFQPTGKLSDFIILFYSMTMASDLNLNLEYDDFLDWLDEHPEQLTLFTTWLTECINKNNSLANKNSNKTDSTAPKN